MINNTEINRKAVELKVSRANVQRDYVFGWLLRGIYSNQRLRDLLVLKGGNCIRKAYLRHGRFSDDLDFSTETEVNPDELKVMLNSVCLENQRLCGVNFDLGKTQITMKKIADVDRRIFEAKVYFKGFYGEEKLIISVQLDISEYDKIQLPIQNRQLVHDYSDVDKCQSEIRCYHLEEVLADKLKSILQRKMAQDLFDFVYVLFLNREVPVNKGLVLSTFLRKTIFENAQDEAKEQLLNISFSDVRPFWGKIVSPAATLIDFDRAVSAFREVILSVFAGPRMRIIPSYARASIPVSPGGFGISNTKPSYFFSDVRDIIINAGRSRTLVRMVYDDYERLVEPYSFRYKIRKSDNVGKEYFYGYDRTGGKSGELGIKSFIPDKIGSISPTNTPFSPRWVVEF